MGKNTTPDINTDAFTTGLSIAQGMNSLPLDNPFVSTARLLGADALADGIECGQMEQLFAYEGEEGETPGGSDV